MKTKVLADFQICVKVPLKNKVNKWEGNLEAQTIK